MATSAGSNRARVLALLLLMGPGVGACGGSSAPATRHAPDLASLLRQPVATPSVCSGQVSGSTSGRRSPWVGTVDVSVFLTPSLPDTQVRALGDRLRADRAVRTVYFESADEAYAEFQRLYTCSGDVPRTAVPASYRLVLRPVRRPARDALVARIEALPGVTSVSCDPSSPCTSVTPTK